MKSIVRHRIEQKRDPHFGGIIYEQVFLIIKWNLMKYSVTVESFVGSQVEKEQIIL